MVAEAAGLDAEATQYVLGEGAAGSRLFKTKIPRSSDGTSPLSSSWR